MEWEWLLQSRGGDSYKKISKDKSSSTHQGLLFWYHQFKSWLNTTCLSFHKDTFSLNNIMAISKDINAYFEILVIDMNKLLSKEYRTSKLAKLDLARKEWGFF
ncbi:hypothetical protein Fmac_018858 [Flemingia macrophylla]|uniref:Uncharacterized protein n=1 Tax=Flemingia macrophylla TaxID=520843 RepID=A0ABD1M6K4_9FABA